MFSARGLRNCCVRYGSVINSDTHSLQMSQPDEVFKLDEEEPNEHRIASAVREPAPDFSKLCGHKPEEQAPESPHTELPPNI